VDERVARASLTIVLDADPAEGRCLARLVAQRKLEWVGALEGHYGARGLPQIAESDSEGYPGIDVI